MSEKKPSIEDLYRKLDKLLDVLGTITRDLAGVSKSLKEVGVPTVVSAVSVEPSKESQSVKDVKVLFSLDLEEMLTFKEAEHSIIVKPRRFLGSDNFARILYLCVN